MTYDDAVAALYHAPHGEFVTERKRIAGELKAAGDKAGAAKLGKLARPPISAWTVNQLWWQAREDFDALFESAEKLRGNISATAEHREAMAKLRARAHTILSDAGNAAAESTLRRVTTTLAALAATGSFDPDPPGALTADRDPPGFEAIGITALEAVQHHATPEPDKHRAPKPDAKPAKPTRDEAAEEEKRRQAEAAAERRRKEQAEAKRLAELRATETALGTATSELERKQKELDRLTRAVEQAQQQVDRAQAAVDELAATLAEQVRAGEEAGAS